MNIKRFVAAAIAMAGILAAGPKVSAYDVPANTDVHLYMDYQAITNTASDQYKLEKYCYTNSDGLRCYLDEMGNEYYLVALSQYYGTEIGTTYVVTLDNGSTFYIMLGDCKDPKDITNIYGRSCWNFIRQTTCTNVLEFIVDTDELPQKVLNWGTVTALDYFNGNITSIEKIGRLWDPEVPFTYYC